MILQTTGGFNPEVFDGTLFPLGPWCLPTYGPHVATAMGLSKDGDLDIGTTTDRILQLLERQLYPALNDFHGVDLHHDVWHHSLGTYLRVLTPLVVLRYNLIQRVINVLGYNEFTFINVDEKWLTPKNRSALQICLNSHAWNHALFAELCTSLGMSPRPPSIQRDFDYTGLIASSSRRPNSTQAMKRTLMSACNSIVRRTNSIVTQTMLPNRIEFGLACRLKTLPFYWFPEESNDIPRSNDTHHQLLSKVHSEDHDEGILLRTIARRLPHSYVEDFHSLRQIASMRLPTHPRRVFTSNLHQSSDGFLLWLSEKRHAGTHVAIAQHGGVHSLCRDVPADVSSEIALANSYFAWGDQGSPSAKLIAGPTLVNVGVKRLKRKVDTKKGPLLVVLDVSYRYPSIPRGMNGSRFEYAQMINELILGLDRVAVPEILLRPYRGAELYDDSIIDLLTPDPRISVDYSFPPIEERFAQAQMVVTTSLGTTFFQTTHHGIPSIMLLNPILSPISAWAEEGLMPLRKAAVFFDNPKQASTHINRTMSASNSWWSDLEVKRAIELFHDHMSPSCNSPIRYFAAKLRQFEGSF